MTEEAVVKTLLEFRVRLTAGAVAVLQDVHHAEDVFQEVLIRAMKLRDSFGDAAGLLAWARVSARNLAIDLARRRDRLNRILSEGALDAVDACLTAADDMHAARIAALRTCLEQLPSESRQLLHLRYHVGHKGSDLSAALGRSEAALYKALSRLHLLLRKCIDDRLAAQEGT